MHFLFSQIKQKFPNWNKHEFTIDDCWEYVDKNNIRVEQFPFPAKGYYGKYKYRGRWKYYIVLDSGLCGIELLQVFLHEIGHHALHEPYGSKDVLYYRREFSIESKQDYQAELFSVVAIIPFTLMYELLNKSELHPLTLELCNLRLKVYEMWQI